MKQVAFVIISAILIAGCVLVAGCTSQSTPTNNTFGTNQENLGIIGTWISEGTYETGGLTFNQVYTFESDKSGTLSAVSVSDGKIIKTVEVMWGFDASQNAYMAYTPNTNNYDYLLLSEDGKTITSEYGEVYTRI